MIAASLALLLLVATAAAPADEVLLQVDKVPADGLVVADLNLASLLKASNLQADAARAQAFFVSDGKAVPTQFVPGARSSEGTLVLQLPPGGPHRLRLAFGKQAARATLPKGSVTIETPYYRLAHDAKQMGGFPPAIEFLPGGKKIEQLSWNDRLHHRQEGGFNVKNDRDAQVELISDGPLCRVVRVRARYQDGRGKWPASQPAAEYTWFYFLDRPVVFVTAAARQKQPKHWDETHFLELTFSSNTFAKWIGGDPAQQGTFSDANKSFHVPRWGAVVDGNRAVGMISAGRVYVYDSGSRASKYLQAHGDMAWKAWDTTERSWRAWLWVGTADKPEATIAQAAGSRSGEATAFVTLRSLRDRIAALRGRMASSDAASRRTLGRRVALAEWFEERGSIDQALAALEGKPAEHGRVLSAGDLELHITQSPDGLRLPHVLDVSTGTRLAGSETMPMWELTLRQGQDSIELRIGSHEGWKQVDCRTEADGRRASLTWQGFRQEGLATLKVSLVGALDAARSRVSWQMNVDGVAKPWSAWHAVFPQLAVSPTGPNAQILMPTAAGVVKPFGRNSLPRTRSIYPSGWLSMQMAAVYDLDRHSGLYFAVHDPVAATKELIAEPDADPAAARLAWDVPVADMGRPGNRYALSGEAVWQVLHGDWFDAAVIYRDWVRREAKWYPKLGPDGRPDTPMWMRELPAWALSGGMPRECESQVIEFAKALGVPIGFHWYSWHKIPFDNDYPHYFPTKEGFAEAVGRLQAAGVSVMPYINGRLWDTHDRGTEDFEFTKIARPAATKNEAGEPYVESYSSKETNGDKVRLAAMCPTTKLWKDQQLQIVLRLMNEFGVRGVYMDQIAAARPVLCFDAAHGHPLGGGSWWTESGYWPMLDAIRAAKPVDRMLTTECNAEPYVRWFDGYLSWHWQYDGQVPAFPAVYGGTIQMFGRAYRAGPTKDLALRMKAGQQLVFGEQIGWIGPGVVKEKDNFGFLREVVRLRWQTRRYFYAGEMARPPRLSGEIPAVTADWQWSGVWPVTTSALMAGAWHLPAEKRLVMLLVNVSDKPIEAALDYDLGEYGFVGSGVTRRRLSDDASQPLPPVSSKLHEKITFPPKSAWAWEFEKK